MARHDTAPSASGAYGRLGPLITRMLATGAAMSSDKSLAPIPTGICSTRSRLVHSVWIESWRRSPLNGACAGSTSERNTSLPM